MNEFEKELEEMRKKYSKNNADASKTSKNKFDVVVACQNYSNALNENISKKADTITEANETIENSSSLKNSSSVAIDIVSAISKNADELESDLNLYEDLINKSNDELHQSQLKMKTEVINSVNTLVNVVDKAVVDLKTTLEKQDNELDEFLGKYELTKKLFVDSIESITEKAHDVLEEEDNKILISEIEVTEEENTIVEPINKTEETVEEETAINEDNNVNEKEEVSDIEQNEPEVEEIVDNIEEPVLEPQSESVLEPSVDENSFTPVSIEPDHIEDEKHEVVNEEPTDINQYKDPINDMLNNSEEVVTTPIETPEQSENNNSYKASSDNTDTNVANESLTETKAESEPVIEEKQKNWVEVKTVENCATKYGENEQTATVTDTTEFKEENKPVEAIPITENKEPEFVSENTELINLDGMNLNNEEPAQVRAAA